MRNEIVISAIEPGLGELESIWDYIGYEESEKTEKLHSLAQRLQQPLFDFISAENQLRVELEASIESRKRRAAQICQSLRLPPFFPPRGLPSLQLQQHLEQHIAQFEQAIRERRQRLGEVQARVQQLCDRMELDASVEAGDCRLCADDEEFIPTEQDLEKLDQLAASLEQRQQEMQQRMHQLAEDVRRIAEDIEHRPEDDFQAAVIGCDEASLKFSEQTLSNMDSLRLSLVKQKAMLVGTCDELRQHVTQMWTRLGIPEEEQRSFLERHSGYRPSSLEALQEESDKCQELKWSQLPTYVASLRAEAEQLCDSSFLPVGDVPDCPDDSEESVAALELRIDELRDAYERNKDLYAAVGQYHVTWAAYMEAEVKMKDPAILSNRGGVLLKTDKERKQLLKELPKVEAKVSELLQRLGGKDFSIQGRSFQEHVQHLWQQFRSEQEAAKFSRKASSSRDSSANAAVNSPRKSLSASSKR